MILKMSQRQSVQPVREKRLDKFSLFLYINFNLCIEFSVAANHVEELSEHIQRDMKLSRAASSEKRGHREAGADGGEVVIRVHRTSIRQVRT